VAAWDRRKDESEVEYARFYAYLRLGPLRTLADAYTKFTAQMPNAKADGVKRRRAPGQWHADSIRFQWRKRAGAWDVSNLKQHGTKTAVLFLRSLERVAAKVYKALPKSALGGDEWPDIMASLNLLGKQLTPDALRGEDEDAAGDGDTGEPAGSPAASVE